MPRAGHDLNDVAVVDDLDDFNSRAPCGARHGRHARVKGDCQFQLTCPVRGTTVNCLYLPYRSRFQLTCPVRGTTRFSHVLDDRYTISTHVPRAGHDWTIRSRLMRHTRFQLTCPVRGTTEMFIFNARNFPISTHVPRAGHDTRSRTGRGAGRRFQLTCPVRGTTAEPVRIDARIEISTHVPRAGHDQCCCSPSPPRAHFNSRAPCGARQ